MLDFSNENRDDSENYKRILDQVKEKEKLYINTLFDEPEFSYLDSELEKILSIDDYEVARIATLE